MQPVAETDRLILRKLTFDDIDRMHEILSDPMTMQFWPKPFDRDGAERWVKRSIDAYRELGFGRYAIILKSSGKLIGDCGYMRIEVNGVTENDLGYILDRTFWGQGLATEAARACLKFGLESLGLVRIVASMEAKHLASRAVAERIGLRFEREFINPRNRNLPTALLSIDNLHMAGNDHSARRELKKDLKIEFLKADRESISIVSNWLYGEWGIDNPNVTLEATRNSVTERAGRNSVPFTLVAVVDGSIVGTASVVKNDLAHFPQFTPWLASVYVVPSFRRMSIAEGLCQRADEIVKQSGLKEYFLFTYTTEKYYSTRGWKTVGKSENRGKPITIMRKDL